MGTELENLCSLLCIFILHVSILTHASPSPPLLTFGARHSHGCGRLYACSPPGGTQCPPFAVHVTVINTTTTTRGRGREGDMHRGERDRVCERDIHRGGV